MKISRDRFLETFLELVSIDGAPRNEKNVNAYIRHVLNDYVTSIEEDTAGDILQGNSGNLLITLKGTDPSLPPIILSAHMDTVSSTCGIVPTVAGDRITSGGATILGADDRLGIAIICEVVRSLKENQERYGDVEIVFSICEEIGLCGAKEFDYSRLTGKAVFVLDSGDTDVGTVICKSPTGIRYDAEIHGKAAHAGIAPETGVNAIEIAAKAIARIEQGRLSPTMTANIGKIEGGSAFNVVPDIVRLNGEVRSYIDNDAHKYIQNVKSIFHEEAVKKGGSASIVVYDNFTAFDVSPESLVIELCRKAFKGKIILESAFGGSDANVFNQKGFPAVVLGIGARKLHSCDEYVVIDEIVSAAEWIYNIVLAAGK
ncbi:MAG: M20/M25/M40 family metallo-hydrolase [bacterium]|nr:M20/M25/M40 family metallo-hydrolase [bacterium]